jgi:hypothetical protein
VTLAEGDVAIYVAPVCVYFELELLDFATSWSAAQDPTDVLEDSVASKYWLSP